MAFALAGERASGALGQLPAARHVPHLLTAAQIQINRIDRRLGRQQLEDNKRAANEMQPPVGR